MIIRSQDEINRLTKKAVKIFDAVKDPYAEGVSDALQWLQHVGAVEPFKDRVCE
jgi:hypothetical protein